MWHQVCTTVYLLGRTYGPVYLLVMTDLPTFKSTSFNALFGCHILHHIRWLLLDIAGGHVMATDSLTRGTNRNTHNHTSNYLAVEPMSTAQSSYIHDESNHMDFESMGYASMHNDLGPHKPASMMYVTMQDELQMQEARASFLNSAENHKFSVKSRRTKKDCTVSFGSWPSHGRGLPSDLYQRHMGCRS